MTNETTVPDLIEDARLAAGTLKQANTFETGQAILRDCANALEAAQARIAELEGALKLAEHDISYAFDRLGIPKEKSSVLPVIRAALEGKE